MIQRREMRDLYLLQLLRHSSSLYSRCSRRRRRTLVATIAEMGNRAIRGRHHKREALVDRDQSQSHATVTLRRRHPTVQGVATSARRVGPDVGDRPASRARARPRQLRRAADVRFPKELTSTDLSSETFHAPRQYADLPRGAHDGHDDSTLEESICSGSSPSVSAASSPTSSSRSTRS